MKNCLRGSHRRMSFQRKNNRKRLLGFRPRGTTQGCPRQLCGKEQKEAGCPRCGAPCGARQKAGEPAALPERFQSGGLVMVRHRLAAVWEELAALPGQRGAIEKSGRCAVEQRLPVLRMGLLCALISGRLCRCFWGLLFCAPPPVFKLPGTAGEFKKRKSPERGLRVGTSRLELVVGLEPTTCALRMRCSTN